MLQLYPVYCCGIDVRPSQDHRVLRVQMVQINLQLYPVYLLCNRLKILTGSPDPTRANGSNKPCNGNQGLTTSLVGKIPQNIGSRLKHRLFQKLTRKHSSRRCTTCLLTGGLSGSRGSAEPEGVPSRAEGFSVGHRVLWGGGVLPSSCKLAHF